MATATAIAIRRDAALQRLTAAIASLVGADVAPFVAPKQPELREVALIEWAASQLSSDAPVVKPAQDVELGAEVTNDGTPVVVTEAIDGKTAKKPAPRKKA